VCLAHSTVEGQRKAVSSNRTFLKRAIDLRCREFCLFGGKDARVVCPASNRTYVWMLLGEEGVIAPSAKATRVASADAEPAQATVPEPVPLPEPEEREETSMPRGRKPVNNAQPIEEVRWRTVEPDPQQPDQPA
jgi:hypothetical protein